MAISAVFAMGRDILLARNHPTKSEKAHETPPIISKTVLKVFMNSNHFHYKSMDRNNESKQSQSFRCIVLNRTYEL